METEEPLSARRWGPREPSQSSVEPRSGAWPGPLGSGPRPGTKATALPPAPTPRSRMPVTNTVRGGRQSRAPTAPASPWGHTPALGPWVSVGARWARLLLSESQGPAERGRGRGRVLWTRSPAAWEQLYLPSPAGARAQVGGAGPGEGCWRSPLASSFRLTENMRRLSEYRALGGLTSAWGPRAGLCHLGLTGVAFWRRFLVIPAAASFLRLLQPVPGVLSVLPSGRGSPREKCRFPRSLPGPRGCEQAPLLLPVGTGVGWGHAEGISPWGQTALGRAGGGGSAGPGPRRTGSLRACTLLCRWVCPGPVASLTSQRARKRQPDRAFALSPERGARPVTSFVKNLSALSDWYSVYTSAIAFTVSASRGAGGLCFAPRDPPWPCGAARGCAQPQAPICRAGAAIQPPCGRGGIRRGPARRLCLCRDVHRASGHTSVCSPRWPGRGRQGACPGYGAWGWLRTCAW